MKKVVALAALFALAATPVLALSIKDSKHNLATGTYAFAGAAINAGNYNEICVFCHTPHAADISVTNAPLWNRTTVKSYTQFYNSSSITATTKAVNAGALNTTDVPLCLSCHDGSSLGDALQNPLNSFSGAQPTGLPASFGTNADLGVDMRNDHPVGMNYSNVQSDSTEGAAGLHASPSINGSTNIFYGGVMWCSSCHDVHDNANAPFLRTTNAGSTLCLKCHNK